MGYPEFRWRIAPGFIPPHLRCFALPGTPLHRSGLIPPHRRHFAAALSL